MAVSALWVKAPTPVVSGALAASDGAPSAMASLDGADAAGAVPHCFKDLKLLQFDDRVDLCQPGINRRC